MSFLSARRLLVLPLLLAGCGADPPTNGAASSSPHGVAPGSSSSTHSHVAASTDPSHAYAQRWSNRLELPLHAGGEGGTATSPMATSIVALAGNLDARSSIKPLPYDPTNLFATAQYLTSLDMYDANGTPRTVLVAFVKTATDAWDFHLITDGGNLQDGTRGMPSELGGGSLAFDPAGNLTSVSGATRFVVTFAGTGAAQPFELRFRVGADTLTQRDGFSATVAFGVDGHAAPAVPPPQHPPAIATEIVSIAGNLDATAPPTYVPWDPKAPVATSSVMRTATVRDGAGRFHAMRLYFAKTATDTWSYHAMVDASDLVGGPADGAVEVGSGALSFTTTGALNQARTDVPLVLSFREAPPFQCVAVSFGRDIASGGAGLDAVTQFAAPSTTADAVPKSPTLGIAVQGFLDVSAAVGTEIRAYGAVTPAMWVGISFVKTDASHWSYQAVALGSGVLRASSHATVVLGTGVLRFREGGTLDDVSSTPLAAHFPGMPDHTLTLSFRTPLGDDPFAEDGVLLADPSALAPLSVSITDDPHLAFAPPRATTLLAFVGNLDGGSGFVGPFDPTSPDSTSLWSTQTRIYDSLGAAHLVGVYFGHASAGTWTYDLVVDGGETAAGTPGVGVVLGTGELHFDAAGALTDAVTLLPALANFAGASPYQAIAVDFGASIHDGGSGTGGVTQRRTYGSVSAIWQNGRPAKAP